MKIQSNTVSFCIPVVAEDYATAKRDIENAVKIDPDLLEIRRDYFNDPENEIAFLELLKKIRQEGTEILFTFRDAYEGGAREATYKERLEAIKKAIENDACDYIDIELQTDMAFANEVLRMAQKAGKKVVRSAHDFKTTPDVPFILSVLEREKDRGDIAKAAYFCQDRDDLRTLINAGDQFRKANPETPLILIGMGEEGVLTRVMPELLESNLTFVTDTKASAPGQKSLEEVKQLREGLA